MRWSLVVLAIVIVPAIALAKPKLAVAPLDGDKDGAVADVIAEEAAEHGKTTKPERVAREMEKLELSSLSAKSVKKLRSKLEVDVVIHGKLEKDGGKKHLELVLNGPGNSKGSLDVDFRTTKDLKKALASKLGRAIENASTGKPSSDRDDEEDDSDKRASPLRGHNDDDGDKRKNRDDDGGDKRKNRDDDDGDKRKNRDDDEGDKRKNRDDDDGDKRKNRDDDDDKRSSPLRGHDDDDGDKRKNRDDDDKRKNRDDDDKRKNRDDDDKRKNRDDDDKRKRTSSRDDDDSSVRRGDDDDDDDDGGSRRRKKKRRHDEVRHPLTQAAAWADAGVGFARRTFTYVGGGMTPPPPVGTAAPAGQIEAELYPGSFSTLKGPAAGIGIAGAFDRELALGIAVPGTTVVAPVSSGYYWFGARYRFSFGSASVALGASYWRRTYVVDRSKLMMPEQLDMPDVDYTAVAPDITARIAASPKLGVFVSAQLPLMLNSGPIQANTSYGPSTILAFDVRSGAQYAFGAHYALQVALAFDQIGFKFGAKQGTMAAAREVTAATDRSIGLAATLGIMY